MGDNDFKLVLNIDGNSLSGQQSVTDLIEKLKGLGIQAKVSGKETSDAHEGAAISASKLGEALKGAYENPQQSLKSLVTGVDEELVGALGTAAAGAAVLGLAIAGALVESAVHAIELGEQLQDVGDKLDTTSSNAASLKYMFDVAGGSIEQASNLLFSMQQRMENNPGEFEKGLHNIGLRIEDIQGLDPLDMFLKLAGAFKENTDHTNRASTAVDLFGRQGRDAISILMKPLQDLNREFKDNIGYSDDAAKNAERLAEIGRKLKANFEWLETGLGVKVLHLLDIVTLNPFTQEERDRYKPNSMGQAMAPVWAAGDAGEARVGIEGNPLGRLAIAANPTGLSLTPDEVKRYIAADTAALDLKNAQAKVADEQRKRWNEFGAMLIDRMEAYQRAEIESITESERLATDAQSTIAKALAGQNILQAFAIASGLHIGAGESTSGLNTSVIGGSLTSRAIGDLLGGTPNVRPSTGFGGAGHPSLGETIGAHLPGAIVNAIEGGGNVGGSIGSTVGQDVGQQVGASAAKALGGVLGSVAGSAIPIVGTLLGGVLGSAVGKLFGGPSESELKSRSDRDSFMEQFGGTNAQGIQKLASELTHAGVSAEEARTHIAAMLDAKTPEEFSKALEPIQAQLDLEKKSWAELPQVLQRVTDGVNAISAGSIGAMNAAANGVDTYSTQIDALNTKRDTLLVNVKKLEGLSLLTDLQKAQLRQYHDQLAEVDTQLHHLHAEFDASATAAADFGTTGQDTFDRTGRLAQTAFHAAMASGKSFAEAINAIGPTLDDLTTAQQMFGFTSSETLTTLLGFRQFATDNQQLMGTLDGVNQMMSGLHEMGLLTQQDFDDLNATAVDTFNKMTAGGVGGDTALRAMQPTLQTIWQMQHDFGMAVDDSTQALLNQAVQANIVGEQFKSVQEQTLDVLRAIARVLGADIPNALNHLPTQRTIDVAVHYTDPGVPEPSGESPPAFPTEAYVRYPTLAIIGDVAGGEFVLKPSTIARYMNAATAAGAAAAGGAAGAAITVNVDASGSFFRDRASMQELGDVVVEALSDKARALALIGLR